MRRVTLDATPGAVDDDRLHRGRGGRRSADLAQDGARAASSESLHRGPADLADGLPERQRRAVHGSGVVGSHAGRRRELPLVLRGVLLAIACEGVQLALLAESRGWLFTLPAVLLVALFVVRDRLRIAVAAIIPVIGALVPLHRLLHVYEVTAVARPTESAFDHAAKTAGATSLVCCLVVLIAGTLVLVAEDRFKPREVKRSVVLAGGLVAAVLALAVASAGAVAATHGHPIRFFNEQWHGFTHPSTTNAAHASHFASTGSEREDAWRVALDAFSARPIGGLGQDNFSDYYTAHGRTGIELAWVHSWELRLLAHTGIVGFLAFIAFLVAAAIAAASQACTERVAARRDGRNRAVAVDRVAASRVRRLVLGDAGAERRRRSRSWRWPGR